MRSQLTCAWSSVADLIELRKLRKAREGIDVAKLSKGDIKKKRKRPKEGEEEVGAAFVDFIRDAIRSCSLEFLESFTGVRYLRICDVGEIEGVVWVVSAHPARRRRRRRWEKGLVEDPTLLFTLPGRVIQPRMLDWGDACSAAVGGACAYILTNGPNGLCVSISDPSLPVFMFRSSDVVAISVTEGAVFTVYWVVPVSS